MLGNQYVDINMILNELNDETNAVQIFRTSNKNAACCGFGLKEC